MNRDILKCMFLLENQNYNYFNILLYIAFLYLDSIIKNSK